MVRSLALAADKDLSRQWVQSRDSGEMLAETLKDKDRRPARSPVRCETGEALQVPQLPLTVQAFRASGS